MTDYHDTAYEILAQLREWRDGRCFVPPGESGIHDYGHGLVCLTAHDRPNPSDCVGSITTVDDGGYSFFGKDPAAFRELAEQWRTNGLPTLEEMDEACYHRGIYRA